ncbi:MAG: hypothetical protein KA259_04890, partial [Caldilineaceae bacterium]|nr:hypothetical protein [Caldilineaceae bacterium]
LLGAGDPSGEAAAEPSPLQRLDDVLQEVLHSLNVPTQRDLGQLQTQLDELNARISILLAEEEARVAGDNVQEKRTDTATTGDSAS